MSEQDNRRLALAAAYMKAKDDRKDRIEEQIKAHAPDFSKGRWDQLFKAVLPDFREADGVSPSQWAEAHSQWVFKDLVYPRFREAFLYTLDNIRNYPYQQGWYRRPLRSDCYEDYTSAMGAIIETFFHLAYIDADLKDILTGKLPEDVLAYRQTHQNGSVGFAPAVLAYELDKEDPVIEAIVKDIICGEGTYATVSRPLIQGIVMSRNTRMHKLLCDLLVAARLQEGLRQTICECGDMGTKEAFFAILQTIRHNDLIRFSSVKRAIGTWTALVGENTKDLDRIGEKTLELISGCLADPAYREDCLRSEDSMKIHLALWSIAFHSIGDTCIAIRDILQKGTRHQILTASYFVNALGFGLTSHDVAKSALAEYHTDLELTAAYLPLFLPNHTGLMGGGLFARGIARWTDYFENRKEALHFCDLLTELHKKIPKKGLTYDPCIFPWHKEELKPSVPLEKAMTIAVLLNDRERMDAMCAMIPALDADARSTYLKAICSKDKTPAVRAAIIAALSDKSDYVRRTAYYLCKEIKLTPAEYRKIEDLLRLKYEDLRRYAADLLLSQPDKPLTDCLCRLLADSKAEKRTGALDMLTTLNKQEGRKSVLQGCIPHIQSITAPTTREQVLIGNLLPKEAPKKKELPYTEADRYRPGIPLKGYAAECLRTFTEYFPHSKLEEQVLAGKEVTPSVLGAILPPCKQIKETKALLQDLSDYFRANDTAFFMRSDDTPIPIGSDARLFLLYDGQRREPIAPRLDLWEQWADSRSITHRQLLAMLVLTAAQPPRCDYLRQCGGYIRSIFGAGFEVPVQYPYLVQMHRIVRTLLLYRLPEENRRRLSIALHLWVCRCLPEKMHVGDDGNAFKQFQTDGPFYINYGNLGQFIYHPQLNFLLHELHVKDGEAIQVTFPLMIELFRHRGAAAKRYLEKNLGKSIHNAIAAIDSTQSLYDDFNLRPRADDLRGEHVLTAYAQGIITRGNLYSLIMELNLLQQTLQLVTSVCAAAPAPDTTVSAKALAHYGGIRIRRTYEEFIGTAQPLTDAQQRRIDLCREIADVLVPIVLEAELDRSEEPTEFSYAVKGIQSLSGAETFVRILRSLGKDTPDRGMYYYGSGNSRRSNLSYLLSRCAPAHTDTAETLTALLKGTGITDRKLIEAALYSPDWIDLIGEHLGIEGFKSACYYFMAHMNERFDDRKAAIIARFTPLTEQELNQGAFDLQWFRSAYEQLGEQHFAMIYDAAKYIADGNKHTRARKYADAALGKLDRSETEEQIRSKRNKELLMAYPLIPLADEDDLLHRYLFLQQFLKESRSFGAQRAASEKQAVESALQNLSINAGYADTMRLTLQMESRMLEDRQDLFADTTVGEWSFRLHIDEHGSPEILCSKDGKQLKSIPAKAKKDPHVVRLTETKTMLTEQYRRTRTMLEQAMEEQTAFSLRELQSLWENPVVRPMLAKLVFRTEEGLGWFEGSRLMHPNGSCVTDSPEALLTLAHPLHLYRSGQWADFQAYIFAHKIVQPFKQVFRELYVKTDDELHTHRSLRYAGNQLQPKKAAACLKGRRWVADYEAGLQKVYYKENIVVTLYAMADWFSPSDIEAPTLEWVEFSHRKTGAPIPMEQIPDVLFSEVMRDVDMAVSVAHAGGVDPEASHSTVEMRAALAEYILPMLGIGNAAVEGSHVIIHGTRGKYTVHLGSGVVHQIGGTMLNVLPVHSQHRGRFFLPFLDSDPKTAEIISKIILFSEDKKLKDPTILSQIIH